METFKSETCGTTLTDKPVAARETQTKHLSILESASVLERSINTLQDLVYEITGHWPDKEKNAEAMDRDPSFVEVIDMAPQFMNGQAEKVRRIVSEIKALLF